jgi:hypothetical protein
MMKILATTVLLGMVATMGLMPAFAAEYQETINFRVVDVCYGSLPMTFVIHSVPSQLTVQMDVPDVLHNCSYSGVQPVFQNAIMTINNSQMACFDTLRNHAVNTISDCKLRLTPGILYDTTFKVLWDFHGIPVVVEKRVQFIIPAPIPQGPIIP